MQLGCKSWISQYSFAILLIILLQGVVSLELLSPGEESYDALDSSSGYKAEFRILKQQTSESVELVTVDSLSVTYVLQAKYVYDNDEVNAHQDYVFSSWSNHLFLTETLQRLPSTNKTLIQLYRNATLIGYDIKLSLGQKVDSSSSDGYEFAIIYYREDDIDTLVDGTLTRFTNMLAGDTEWRKISFQLETTQAMIFTVENGYETEIFMYSAGPGNITQTQQLSPQLVSRYIFTNAKGDQTIFLLLRRAYSTTIANAPDIIDFSLSIFAIFTNNKPISGNPDNSSTGYTWDSKVTGQYASGSNSTLTADSYALSLFRHPFAKFDVLLPIFNIQQLLSSRVTLSSKLILTENPQGKKLLGEQLSRILAYEIIVPIANHTNAYFLGSTATSCNALFKYSVNSAADPLSGNLGLTQDDYDGNFSDKFSNIDSTSTIKTIIQPSAYSKCAPTCVIHAVLYIEILVDPSSDMTTFKLQGTQLLHDLSNPIKPFFDQLPLLAYTFFKVKLDSDLNQLAIQYFSGYDLCYLSFKHSFIETDDDEDEEVTNVLLSNLLTSKQLPRKLQLEDTSTTTAADYWPIFTNIQSVNSQNLYSSGQMIVKPAKKGVHIFSALNLSPIYSSFTVQANSQVLRQLTNSSYIAVSLNGESDMQSLYYDKLYNNDKHIQLQFCSILSEVSLFALSCNSTLKINTCQIPQESNHTYFTQIQSNSTNIPDLCPNTTCHILISLQFTASSTSASNSLPQTTIDNSATILLTDTSSDSSSTQVKKFSISLHEIEATSKILPGTSSSSSSSSDGKVKSTAGGSTQQSPQDEKNSSSSRSFWIIISCCVLLVGIVIVSALTCYLKRKENKLLNEMQLSKLSEKEDNQILDNNDEDDYNDANEDFSNKRTTTHSTEQNNLPDQIDS